MLTEKRLCLYADNGAIRIVTNDAIDILTTNEITTAATGITVSKGWNYIMLVVSGTTDVAVYHQHEAACGTTNVFNGAAVQATAVVDDASFYTCIGAEFYNTGGGNLAQNYFKGVMNEVHVESAARTQAEFEARLRCTASVNCANSCSMCPQTGACPYESYGYGNRADYSFAPAGAYS